jgi:xanthine dehydrogenase YagR molybdenum-binding subunit
MTRPLLQVTGLERSAADVRLPSLLWAWPVIVPLAHAEVLAIDASEALRQRGVVAVLTAETLLNASAARFAPVLRELLSPSVRHAGQPVALVLAESRLLARTAAEKVVLRWRALDSRLTLAMALASGQAEPTLRRTHGEPAEALLRARNRYKQTFRTAPRLADSAVPGISTAIWRGDALTIYTVGEPTRELAAKLGLRPERQLTVSSLLGDSDGSFGPQALLAAVASAHVERPVRVELPALTACGSIAETLQTIQLGLDDHDRPLALLLHGAIGATSDGGSSGLTAVMDLAAAYGFANRELTMVPVRLHLPTQSRENRLSAWPDLTFSIELTRDELADQLATDPLTLRLRWLGNGATGDAVMLRGCLETLHKLSGIEKLSSQSPAGDLSQRRGYGVASAVHRTASGQTLFGAHFVEAELSEGRVVLRRHVCVLSVAGNLVGGDLEGLVQRSCEHARRLALQPELLMSPQVGWAALRSDQIGRSATVATMEVALLPASGGEATVITEADVAMLARSGVAAAVVSALATAQHCQLRTLPAGLLTSSRSGP